MLARFVGLGLLPLLVVACQGKTASAPDYDGGISLTYLPLGCQYSYSPPTTLGFTDQSFDDTGPVDPVLGVPQRVRVGFGGGTTMGQPGYADPTTTAAFTWETAESDHAAKVQLGTSPTSLTTVQTGYTWTVTPTIGTTPSYFHEVHLCGLTPNTIYYYEVGGGPPGAEVWSPTLSFSTLPTGGTLTIGVFGDARDSDSTWEAVHERMKAAGVLLSLVDGDVVDTAAESTLYQQWLGDIATPNTPYFTLGQQYIIPINGNHENDLPMSFANWAIPGTGPYAETYASFPVGSVHFAMFDDEQIAESGATTDQSMAQLAWLQQDLAAANADRQNHPFIIVLNHRGLFSTSLHSTDSDVIAAREALAPIYDQNKVDLVFNGHDHEYERSTPLTDTNGAPTVQAPGQGTTYVICAGAGADAYAVGTTSVPYRVTKTAFGKGTPYIGTYTLLQISPSSLVLTAYGLKASGSTTQDDDVIDTVTLSH